MKQNETPKRKRTNWLWILAIVVVALAFWYVRAAHDHLGDLAEIDFDRNSLIVNGTDPDDILVDLADDASAADVEHIERSLGIDLVLVSAESEDEQFYRAHVAAERRDSILASLSTMDNVELAEPDSVMSINHPGHGETWTGPTTWLQFQESGHMGLQAPDVEGAWADFPNDPQYKFQWHMGQIHMPAAWKLADGEDVIVAVLDTGVAYEDHEKFHRVADLTGVTMVKPFDFVDNDKHANDDHGHGTHVAGTIAQATHNGTGVTGVARNVKIMPLKVLSGSGSGSVAGIADAIRYAADEGADVINMSLGGPFPSRALKKACEYAHGKGVTIIAAAGNDGRSKVGYPAGYPGVVAVSATQYDESITFYSNHGKNIDIAAPGGNTRVDQNNDGMPDGVLQNTITVGDPTSSDYYGFMGTSMASPHAAGVAALVVGEGVNDPDAVEAILKKTARAPATGKFDASKYGAGIIDAEAAVLEARSAGGGWQFVLGLLFAGAVASSVRRRGLLGVKLGAGYLAGAVVGASGLFFLPYLSGSLASLPVVEMLTRGLPSWDLALFGASVHGNALFFSALIPFGLLALLYGSPKLRAPLAGLAIGVAAHLVFHAATGIADIRWMPNAFGLDEVWLTVNAALCLGMGFVALRK